MFQRGFLSKPRSGRGAGRVAMFVGAAGSHMRRVGWQAMPTVEHPLTLPSVGHARHCCLISVQVGDADTSAKVSRIIRTSPSRVSSCVSPRSSLSSQGATTTQGTRAAEQARVASAFDANPPAWSRVTLPAFV